MMISSCYLIQILFRQAEILQGFIERRYINIHAFTITITNLLYSVVYNLPFTSNSFLFIGMLLFCFSRVRLQFVGTTST